MDELDACDEKSISYIFKLLFKFFKDELDCKDHVQVNLRCSGRFYSHSIHTFIQFQKMKTKEINSSKISNASPALLLLTSFFIASLFFFDWFFTIWASFIVGFKTILIHSHFINFFNTPVVDDGRNFPNKKTNALWTVVKTFFGFIWMGKHIVIPTCADMELLMGKTYPEKTRDNLIIKRSSVPHE